MRFAIGLVITCLSVPLGFGQDFESSLSSRASTNSSSSPRPMVISHGGAPEKAQVGFASLSPRAESNSSNGEGSSYRVSERTSRAPIALNQSSDESERVIATGNSLALDSAPVSSRSKLTGPLVTVCSSLAIVLALFSALVWAGRRFGGGAAASKPLPASALTPLGHVMLDPRTKLLLVKCGRRILVLSQTASGITPITEVTHPDEVRELVASCSAEAREVFEKTLREIELEPAHGFTGPVNETNTRANQARTSGRLFATA